MGVCVMSHICAVVRLEFNSGIIYGTHTIEAHEAWVCTRMYICIVVRLEFNSDVNSKSLVHVNFKQIWHVFDRGM